MPHSDNTRLRTLNSVKDLPILNHLLVCQIERQSNLVEKREQAILRIESTPKEEEQQCEQEIIHMYMKIVIMSQSLSYLAIAYIPSTNSHSPKALYRWA